MDEGKWQQLPTCMDRLKGLRARDTFQQGLTPTEFGRAARLLTPNEESPSFLPNEVFFNSALGFGSVPVSRQDALDAIRAYIKPATAAAWADPRPLEDQYSCWGTCYVDPDSPHDQVRGWIRSLRRWFKARQQARQQASLEHKRSREAQVTGGCPLSSIKEEEKS